MGKEEINEIYEKSKEKKTETTKKGQGTKNYYKNVKKEKNQKIYELNK